MPTPSIRHHPSSTAATTHDRDILWRLHRAAMTIRDRERRPAMMEGLGLLVELIEARNRRQRFTDQWDPNQEAGWAE